MKTEVKKHFVNIMLPSVVLSLIVGVITGMIVFAFRVITEHIIELSHAIYTFAGEHPFAIAPIVAGAVLMAFLVSLCLVYSPHSRGGGIPTAVALMRGLITFHWLRNIIFVFTSALFSYLCGIPLGNDEGPAVQMGTAIGSGTSRLTHRRGWERYLMTAGATAGFATVTCARREKRKLTALSFQKRKGRAVPFLTKVGSRGLWKTLWKLCKTRILLGRQVRRGCGKAVEGEGRFCGRFLRRFPTLEKVKKELRAVLCGGGQSPSKMRLCTKAVPLFLRAKS